MTPEIISTCIIAIFVLVLLAGFVFGIARGFNKSLVRILLVVAMLVITFFTVPLITQWLLTVDISNFGISVGGEVATTVPNLIISALNQIPEIADIAGTDAYLTIINVVPQMIINVVMFLVVFLLLRMLSMIIYWIIAGVCFNKKKTVGKNKHRLIGSVIGVVQSFLIFLVLFVPVVGVVKIAGDIETLVNQPTTQAVATATSATEPEQDSQSPDQTPSQDDGLQSALATVNEVVDVYYDTWVAKFLGTFKLDKACLYVFDELSTVEKDQTEYTLREETKNLTVIYLDVKDLQELGEFDLGNIETITALQQIINDCYNSQLTANLIDELIPLAIEKWNAGETFIGISKPTLDGYDNVIDSLLTSLNVVGNKQQLLIGTTNMLKSVLGTATSIVQENGDINIDKVGELLDELSNDPETLKLAQDVIVENIDTIVNQVMTGTDQTTNSYKEMIIETVEAVLGTNYEVTGGNISNEIDVVTETLKVADKLSNYNPDADEPVNITQEDANAVISALDNSVVILNTLKNDQSNIAETLQDTISSNQDAKDYIQNAINDLPDTSTNKQDLLAIFGLNQAETPAE